MQTTAEATPQASIRLCVDCEHHLDLSNTSSRGDEHHICFLKPLGSSLITGSLLLVACTDARAADNVDCGPDGQAFEPIKRHSTAQPAQCWWTSLAGMAGTWFRALTTKNRRHGDAA